MVNCLHFALKSGRVKAFFSIFASASILKCGYGIVGIGVVVNMVVLQCYYLKWKHGKDLENGCI